MGRSPRPSAFDSTNLVCASGPSAASTSTTQPSTRRSTLRRGSSNSGATRGSRGVAGAGRGARRRRVAVGNGGGGCRSRCREQGRAYGSYEGMLLWPPHRSTSPPKSAWPGVSTALRWKPPHEKDVTCTDAPASRQRQAVTAVGEATSARRAQGMRTARSKAGVRVRCTDDTLSAARRAFARMVMPRSRSREWLSMARSSPVA
jgi:hypothetical protein